MTGGKKFLFDQNDFSPEAIAADRLAKLNKPPVYTVAELEQAKTNSFAQGQADGVSQTNASIARETLDSIKALVAAIERLAKAEDTRTAIMTDQATVMVYDVLQTLMPALLDSTSPNQITTFIADTVQAQVKMGKLKISLNTGQTPIIEEKLRAMADQHPVLEDLTIIAEQGLSPHECRIAWTQGGAIWNPDAIAAQILEVFKTHLPEGALEKQSETPHTASHTDSLTTEVTDGG